MTEVGSLIGKRMILISVDEATVRSRYLHDHLAISDVQVDDSGHRIVRVTHEAAWCTGGDAVPSGAESRSTPWPAELVRPD